MTHELTTTATCEYFTTTEPKILLKRTTEYSFRGGLRNEAFELVINPTFSHTLLCESIDKYHAMSQDLK